MQSRDSPAFCHERFIPEHRQCRLSSDPKSYRQTPETTMKVTVLLFVVALVIGESRQASVDKDSIVFIDDTKKNKEEPVITPPVLPVIEHLERDPTTLGKGDNEVVLVKSVGGKGVSPRFGATGGFGVVPSGNGGFTASFSHGVSGLGGQSQSGSHSVTVGGAASGFQVSQSSSQASSFGSNQGFLG